MAYIISAKGVLFDTLEGPLAPHMASFATSVKEAGYRVGSMQGQVRLVGFFDRWLDKNKVPLRDVSAKHAERFLRDRARRRRPRRGDRAALTQFIAFLRDQKVLAAPKIATRLLSPAEHCAQSYGQYLREERALSTACIVNYVPFVREFLQGRFGKGQVALSQLTAGDVVRFVQSQARRLHPKRAKLLTSALRSFLQYTRYRGESTLDLAAAVPCVANWSRPSIPRAIPPDQVRRLLADVDRHTAVGRRDYAILLLLARLGLRSSAVVFLELDDIDWKVGSLRVTAKGVRRLELPLPADVGKAIADYLRNGRPHSASRRVFIRAKAPIRGFLSSSAVGSIVKHSLDRAGVDAPTQGTHQFRHGLAGEMLRHGASLSEIGELLGHRHQDTTKIYTKVDIKALRSLALPWPAGVR
jgi:integrase/recombinase XerD